MTDAATTTERSPRLPFAGVPVRDLVRDVVAMTALLVGLALPWTATARGSDRLEVVLATVVAVLTVALPYAHRAQLFPGAWAADEQRTRWVGLAPLAVVALVHVLLDVLPGGAVGVGAGLGLGLAGAVLAGGLPWRRAVVSVAWVIGLGAVAAPVLAVIDGGVGAWGVVALVLTALLVLGVLWLTAGRFDRQGDQAAGVLLVGVGIVLSVGAALVGGAGAAPWVESVHGTQFGLLLLPVLAAAAVPRVVDQTVLADAQPRLWAQVAVHAVELGIVLGASVALLALVGLISSDVGGLHGTLRLVLGVLIAVVLVFARRALRRDLASGHATAVGAAVVVVVLGLVLVIVRAEGTTAVHPVDLLLAFGVPAVVLSVLLVPRSLHELRSHGPVPLIEPAPDDDVAAPESGYDSEGGYASPVRPSGPAEAAYGVAERAFGAAGPVAGAAPYAAAYGAAAGGEAGAAAAEVQAEVQAVTAPQASAAETTIMAPLGQGPDVPGVEPRYAPVEPEPEPAAPETARPETAAVETAAPETAAVETAAPAVGPFGSVGATQVLPPVVDVPDSPWSAAQALDPATPLADLALIVQESPHLRPLVAANPSTYPALLDWLGALGDPDVDAALRTRG
ncbi:hypothetical protein [Xylanimonas protaetiae]|uniref:Uncharacterized protein n=1 Tax=Xylanimonas protaetiae TaxID=2509457 RepID=A0A4P6F7N9_9MICO|nr:hypothetical protein [Xylanimonas protaetiae]QAY71476.1 hypothetical protein ET471_16770 [Xylanimonas protaetiae]